MKKTPNIGFASLLVLAACGGEETSDAAPTRPTEPTVTAEFHHLHTSTSGPNVEQQTFIIEFVTQTFDLGPDLRTSYELRYLDCRTEAELVFGVNRAVLVGSYTYRVPEGCEDSLASYVERHWSLVAFYAQRHLETRMEDLED